MKDHISIWRFICVLEWQVERRKAMIENHAKIKKPRQAAELSTLDDFLAEEGVLEKFQAAAIKEVIAWQIGEAMKAEGISQKKLAERMGTSRSQVARLLDPADGNVTISTLQRAAEIVGRKIRLELV